MSDQIDNLNDSSPPRHPRIIAIANQKGGVGKTTTAINLATALAAVGQRVLLVDFDPQGNASTGLGIDRERRRLSSYEVLLDGLPVDQALLSTGIPGLDLIAASLELTGAELELVDSPRREYHLHDALTAMAPSHDYVLIDCPPALGLLTLNALVAADAVLVPLQVEFYALEGLSHLISTIERVKRTFNPRLAIQGVVLTMYDRRNGLSELIARDVREHLASKVYQTVIPRNVRVSEAPSHGKPVLLYDLRCAGAQAYLQLASEVLRQEGLTREPIAVGAGR
ncbi:MAG TPA: ParA family protein [Alphaproteobacteria bacterium]|nr:ParA family protein [Alphaproteobacteria bacterium]